jgi:formylglycine-generating enzyme required for sulfatase activity
MKHLALGVIVTSCFFAVVLVALAATVTGGTSRTCMAYGGVPEGFPRRPRAGMVEVEGGTITLGSERSLPEERPGAATRVEAFFSDRHEVTNAQFAIFVRATGHVTVAERRGRAPAFRFATPTELAARPHAWWSEVEGASWRQPEGEGSDLRGRSAHPVVQVGYEDALAYARWLGRDLPTEAEWEHAARGDEPALRVAPRDGSGRPLANYWQGRFPLVDEGEDGFVGQTAPAGCFEANERGLLDLVGNVWEWTRSRWSADHRDGVDEDGGPRVIKGGSFLCSPDYCARYRASARQPQSPDDPAPHLGFRTVSRARERRAADAP